MPNLEARVLVCDPERKFLAQLNRVMTERFGQESNPSPISISHLSGNHPFEYGGVEYTLAGNMAAVPDIISGKKAPYFALVAYAAGAINKSGAAGIIADVRKKDFFLPQMIIGEGIPQTLVGQCARAGVLYFGETPRIAEDQIYNIFKKSSRLPNASIVKIGGSSFDFDRQVNWVNLENACELLVKIHQDRKKDKSRRVNRILVTVGAGQYGDVIKDWSRRHKSFNRVSEYFPQGMALALQANLENLKQMFGDSAALIKTGAFYYIDKRSTSKRIPLIGTAPHYILARDGIPLQDSDTHTIALAEFYHIPRVILLKRTDGIYEFDPNRGCVLNNGSCTDLKAWLEVQAQNHLYGSISVQQMLEGGITREGTGSDGKSDASLGHLMEDSSLRYMSEKCQYVNEIVVVHIAPEEMYYPTGPNSYAHIVTGKPITLPAGGWKGVLEQNILDAFNGRSISKIVKT